MGSPQLATSIKNDREGAHGADIDRDRGHLRQSDIGFGHAFEPTERAAAHVHRLKAHILRNLRHDRIERARGDDEFVALDKLSEIRQEWPLLFLPVRATRSRNNAQCSIG
jgi:hypothetical protein